MKLNDRLVASNYALPPLPHSVLSYGVLIGEMKGRNLVPSHYFYSAFGNAFKKQLELSNKPDMLAAYLRGEQIPLGDGAPLGYTAVTYRGFTIGGGKSIGQSLNNHYPKGLRNKK